MACPQPCPQHPRPPAVLPTGELSSASQASVKVSVERAAQGLNLINTFRAILNCSDWARDMEGDVASCLCAALNCTLVHPRLSAKCFPSLPVPLRAGGGLVG